MKMFFQTSQNTFFLCDIWWKLKIVYLSLKIKYCIKLIFSIVLSTPTQVKAVCLLLIELWCQSPWLELQLPSFAILSLNLPWHDTDLNTVFWKAVAKFQGHPLGMSWLTGMLAGTLCAEGNFSSARTLKASLKGRPRYPPSFIPNKSSENKHIALLPIKARQ